MPRWRTIRAAAGGGGTNFSWPAPRVRGTPEKLGGALGGYYDNCSVSDPAKGHVSSSPVRLDLVKLGDGSFAVMDQRKEIGRLIPTKRRWFWVVRWTELQGYAPTRTAALRELAAAYGER